MIPAHLDPVELDQAMRDDLAESLTYLGQEAGDHLGVSTEEWTDAIAQIRAHPLVPGVFARYYELVFALNDAPASAPEFARGIVERAPQHAEQAVVPFTSAGLDDDPRLYEHMIALGSPDLQFAPPSDDQWAEFEQTVPAALDLIAAADAALGVEVATLSTRICGASAPPRPARQFGGASSFMLWGAIVFNLNRDNGVIAMYDRIVHETTHQLLFGVARAEPLVTNSLAERYTSPLRKDPRPMDGIFHATFVCARVHHALGRLLETADLTADQQAEATKALDDYASTFGGGRETVRAHGLLTPTGDLMLTAAEEHMKQ